MRISRTPTTTSTWTVDTILEYWKDRHVDLQLQMEQRFEAQDKAVEMAMRAQRNAIEAALAAANQATTKAETATEMRFQSVNEFRQTLSDQATQFITRKEVESLVLRNTERVQELTALVQTTASKSEVINAFEGLNARMQELADRINRSEGRGAGLNAGWVYILGAVAAMGTIISIWLVVQGG